MHLHYFMLRGRERIAHTAAVPNTTAAGSLQPLRSREEHCSGRLFNTVTVCLSIRNSTHFASALDISGFHRRKKRRARVAALRTTTKQRFSLVGRRTRNGAASRPAGVPRCGCCCPPGSTLSRHHRLLLSSRRCCTSALGASCRVAEYRRPSGAYVTGRFVRRAALPSDEHQL